MYPTYLGELRYWGNIVLGVTDTLDVDRLRLVINGCGKVLWIIAVDKLDTDTELLQGHYQESSQRLAW